MVRSATFAAAFLALWGCTRPLPEEVARPAAAQVARARTLATEMDQRWHAAIAGTTAEPGLAPCPIAPLPEEVLAMSGGDRISGVLGEVLSLKYPVNFVKASELGNAHSPRWTMADRKLSGAEYSLRPDQRFESKELERAKKELAEAEQYATADFWTWDLIVIIDDEHEAQLPLDGHGFIDSEQTRNSLFVTTKTHFVPGYGSGRGFVYDYRRKAVVCAGRFRASNGRNLESIGGDDLAWTLRHDLHGAAVREGARALRAVP